MIKNFLMTLKRYKVAGVLNIAGLTLAFVAFYIIAAQVWYSVTYNRPLKDSDRVYMISALWGGSIGEGNAEWSSSSPHPVTRETVEMFPQAETFTHFREYRQPHRVWGKTEHGEFQKYNMGSYDMSPDGLDVFGFDIIAGDATQIEQPNTVVISESAARRMSVGVGEQIWFEGGRVEQQYETGVAADCSGNFQGFPKEYFPV